MSRLETDPQLVIHSVPVWRYYRSADALLSQALLYRQARKPHEEYQQLFKYASLVLDTIPKHRDFASFRVRQSGYRRKVAEDVMPRLEKLKPLVTERPQPAHLRKPNVTPMGFANLPEVDWGRSQPDTLALATPANFLEHNATVERAYSQYGASPSASFSGRPPPPLPSADPFAASASFGSVSMPAPPAPPGQLSLLDVPSLPDWARQASNCSPASQSLVAKHSIFPTLSGASAEAASARAQQLYPHLALPDMQRLGVMGDPPQVLALPPQEMQVHNQIVHEVVAPAPGASCDCAAHSHAEAPAAITTEKLRELRDVYIAPHVMEAFLRHAVSNTRRGIESCGILAGSLSSDSSSFTVTTLIIPKQKGEANVVEMLNEEEIFDYQFERGLMPLGWIHTHPTQTCFLSSVDVHTQCGYQVMLSEAVAIVMAPTDPRQKCGIFRLTTPGGMGVVQRCQRRGFHQHEVPSSGQEIYELCGHVFLDESAKFECIDLR